MSANDEIFDAYIRHQVNVLRMSKREAAEMFKVLRASEDDLNGMLKATGGNWTKKRLASVRAEIRKLRTAAWKSYGGKVGDVMGKTAEIELSASAAIYKAALPLEFNFAAPNVAAVRSVATGTPFGSLEKMHTLAEWVVNLAEADHGRIMGALQSGIVNGETIPQIQSRIARVADVSRTQAEALARTGINHASNTARQEMFKENAGVLSALRVVATLDGRTSPICRSYDGKFRPVEGWKNDWEGVPVPHLQSASASPPFHMRCRSLLIGILSGQDLSEQLGDLKRATVTDKRTGKRRQVDFEKDARARYNEDRQPGDPPWNDLPGDEKSIYRRAVRDDWAIEHVGQVPADTTYDQWLRNQDPDFQDQVLGKPRAELYRANSDMTMDSFIDRDGNLITIEELDQISPGPSVLDAVPEAVVDPDAIEGAFPASVREGSVNEWYEKNYLRNEEMQIEVEGEAIAKFPSDLNARHQWVRDEIAARMRKFIPPNEDPIAYKKWIDSLTPDEAQSFRIWAQEGMPKFLRDRQRGFDITDPNYQSKLTPGTKHHLNRLISEHGDLDSVQQYVDGVNESMTGALKRAPRAEGYEVYRGDLWKEGTKVGSVFSHEAISSSTYFPPEAVNFANMRARQFGGKPVVYRHISDYDAVNIQNLVGDPGLSTESELLLMGHQEYVVLEIKEVDHKVLGAFTEVLLGAKK